MERIKKIIGAAAMLAVCLWVCSRIPFSTKIQQEIPAAVYKDGIAVETTSVLIDGKKTHYIFRSPSFEGIFAIRSIEKTCRENTLASIRWRGEAQNVQLLRYYSPGVIHSDLVSFFFIINPEMTRFALSAKDGSVIATSDEVYAIYAKHIVYDPERDSISISGNIPDF